MCSGAESTSAKLQAAAQHPAKPTGQWHVSLSASALSHTCHPVTSPVLPLFTTHTAQLSQHLSVAPARWSTKLSLLQRPMSSSVLWYPTRWVYCEVMDAIQGEGCTQLCAYHSAVAIEQLGGHFHISIQSINELWNLDQILIMLTPLGLLPGGRHTNTRDVSFLYALLCFRNLKCEPGLFIQINKDTNSGSYGPE